MILMHYEIHCDKRFSLIDTAVNFGVSNQLVGSHRDERRWIACSAFEILITIIVLLFQ